MSNKLLAVDMDGTLFDDDKKISKENLEAITKLLDAGHVFAFDTGRPNNALKKILSVYKEFHRDNVYMLGYQGVVGTTMLSDDILFGDYIDEENAIELVNAILEANFTCIVFDNGCIYTFNDNHFIESYKQLSKEQLIYITDVNELKGKHITKIMAVDYDYPEHLQAFKDDNASIFDDRFESFFSHYAFLEYVKRGTGKGDGIKKLAEFLNIPLSHVVACGDERNDISMVELAGVGVAMANGRDELKAVADYVTENDNNNSGIAEVINKFFI
ncbi:Cof-type HAD-IIB family hydrolase [Pseudobutyrivibrio xylanivorans]|nr:Cof-type HAD-IIB family hydrolase [Pseudobutyrivibrio xylanivorans]